MTDRETTSELEILLTKRTMSINNLTIWPTAWIWPGPKVHQVPLPLLEMHWLPWSGCPSSQRRNGSSSRKVTAASNVRHRADKCMVVITSKNYQTLTAQDVLCGKNTRDKTINKGPLLAAIMDGNVMEQVSVLLATIFPAISNVETSFSDLSGSSMSLVSTSLLKLCKKESQVKSKKTAFSQEKLTKSQGKVKKYWLFVHFSWPKAIFFDFTWLSFLQSVIPQLCLH